MTFTGRQRFCLAAGVSLACLVFAPVRAETAPDAPAGASPRTMPLPLMPPTSPPIRSPVAFFRELLAMNPAERRQSLTNRPPEIQKRILAKVREYESLRPNERELRLRVTELTWYLLPLMRMPATNRAARLAEIPEEDRQLVQDRLLQWDRLPPDAQKELLDNEATLRYFTELRSGTELQKKLLLENMSAARRQKLVAGIQQWQSLSEDQRQNMTTRFNQFFELTTAEKVRALNTLSTPEQRQMEKTLQSYAKLSPAQRAQCLRSFQKFASMSLADRQQFLKNAERWKLMSPAERDEWRKLVTLMPLLPQGVGSPMPPRLPHRSTASIATNTN
jgi:Protein of unknown function (DUF3106)